MIFFGMLESLLFRFKCQIDHYELNGSIDLWMHVRLLFLSRLLYALFELFEQSNSWPSEGVGQLLTFATNGFSVRHNLMIAHENMC